ncbi:MAG: rhomboid family intramembrane serine protease [Candidatus Angelobacter sp.]
MRQPPKWIEFHRYPTVAGTALLATGVTVASWASLDVSPLFENAMIRHGELWRLVTSILPHAGMVHLVFNIYWLWVFGTLIEEIYGHFKTLGLILLFAIIPNTFEYAFSAGGIGLSGVGYGLFGLLWVLSRYDERFRDAMDGRTIKLFILWFVFCIFATLANIMAIGNIAHGTGAVIGLLTGLAITLPQRRVSLAAGMGLVLALGLWGATLGRPKVNFSTYASYEECKWGFDAMKAGHNQEALRWLQSAARYHSNQGSCLTDLGYVYQTLDRPSEALTAYRKAAEMGEPDSEFYIGEMYRTGSAGLPKDAQQALHWYHKAAEHGSPDVLNNVAWAMETSSDPAVRNPATALDYARRAVNADKDNPKPYVLDTLAYAYFLNKQYEDAVKTEQQASELATPEEQKEYSTKMKVYQLALQVEKKLPKRDKQLARGD